MRPVGGIWRRLPLGLLGTLALIAAVEGWEVRQGDELSHPWAGDWKHGQMAVGRDAPTSRVLCFGDSLMKYGVVPRVLEARLGRSSYNLALGAAPPVVSYAMLDHALAAGARPDAILVDFAPHLLGVGPQISSLLLPEVLQVADCLTLGWETRDADLMASVALARIFPSVKDRLEIRAAIVAALGGLDRTERRLASAAARRNWEVNRGAHLAFRSPRYPGDDTPWAGHLYPAAWRCTPLNAIYVRKFLRLASSRSIPVFWLIPPFSPEVHARRAAAGLDDLYTAHVARVIAKFPGVTVIDGRQAGYVASVHADSLHLDRRGAAVFTEEVAEVVARHLAEGPATDRWVHLPPYRDRPADGPFEDILQSRVATQAAARSARR